MCFGSTYYVGTAQEMMLLPPVLLWVLSVDIVAIKFNFAVL